MKTFLISMVMIIVTSAFAQQAPSLPGTSAAALVQVTPTPTSLVKGHQLAAMLNSDEVTKIQFDKMFSKTMPDAMRQVPTYQALEKQYPGIIMAIVDGSRPIIEAETQKEAPKLIDQLGALYARYLTDAELDVVLEFYQSPTGHWLIMTIASGSDGAVAMQKLMNDPEAPMAATDITNSTIKASIPNIISGMTPERMKSVMAFMSTKAGRKIKALQPQSAEISADWANEMKASAQQEVATAMIGIAQKYIAEHGGPDKAAAGS